MIKVWWVVAWDQYYPESELTNVRSTWETKEKAEQEAADLLRQGYREHVQVINVSDLLGLTDEE